MYMHVNIYVHEYMQHEGRSPMFTHLALLLALLNMVFPHIIYKLVSMLAHILASSYIQCPSKLQYSTLYTHEYICMQIYMHEYMHWGQNHCLTFQYDIGGNCQTSCELPTS